MANKNKGGIKSGRKPVKTSRPPKGAWQKLISNKMKRITTKGGKNGGR